MTKPLVIGISVLLVIAALAMPIKQMRAPGPLLRHRSGRPPATYTITTKWSRSAYS